ncbi:hypothetical protein BDV33DRAFT_195084 [Aspergillus novoparasiticus]|uniref:Zn(2)-C6 fungal-type domain-containing protein n=1 Tax=Aspergillus novoparasiticus TaxID=986946 RepID=A0A5N6EE01_9EURO|nr:hypothetical protein BDV33DRAFT_195084 [Aspergillus novoparasiticus]
MPPRRSHKKTRNGCDQCKERRGKCDEKHPICSNCTSRELTCTYLKIPIVSAPGRTAQTVTDRSLDPPHQEQSQPKNQDKQPISSVVSAEPSFVLRDLELMHKFSTDTFRCLSLNALTPVNCDAVFVQSAIITVIGIALPRLNVQHRGECFSMIENMVTVFELLQGSTKVSHISRPWLSHGANREAIDLLRSCFAKFARSSHPVAILAWLVYTKKEFIDGLRMRQPFPLLILMHWGVLLNELGCHFWWAKGCGRDLVTELLAEIKSEDPVWKQALEWPRKMIGV